MTISRIFKAAALASTMLALPTVAFAQTEPVTPENPPRTSSDASDSSEGIVVVGSRIRRPDAFTGADAINVVTRDEATAAGFNSTAEILQSNAITGGTDQINQAYGGFVVAGGPGVQTVGLRGLGPQRTLILLDGRRVAPAGARGNVQSADLNVLPNALIDRVEILNTGASSVYGSDAVAGVINIVTRQNVNGITAEAQHNITEEGGGNSRRYSVVAGFSNDSFRVSASLEYFKQDRIQVGQRDWLSCPTTRYGTNGSDFGAADFIDPRTGRPKCFSLDNGGVTVNTIGIPNLAGSTVALAPGVPAGYTGICNRFRPNSAVTTGAVPGYECVGGGTLATDIRDTSSINHLVQDFWSPVETYTGYIQGSYEIGALGGAEVYGNFLFNRRESTQSRQRQFTLDYVYGSPLIPVGLRFATPFLAAGGAAVGAPAVGVRAFVDYGIYENYQTNDFVRVNAGLRGDIGGTGWRYDLNFNRSWSDSSYTSDLILTDRYWQSQDVVQNANGTFSCRGTAATAPGCVAAPALTPQVIGGGFREVGQAWFDFVTAPVTGVTKLRESIYNLTLDGPLFRLPGGMVQAAVGVEYRKSRIDDTPSEESQRNNLYGFSSSSITRGTDAVKEAYAEIELPLVRDSFIRELTINASGRYTEYDSYGGDWTYKVGGLFTPVRGLSFRGSYGTSFRAPALAEQFLGATTSFLGNSNDPCNNYNATTAQLIRDRCAAEGLPGNGAFSQNSSITVRGLGGAEAGLAAETSTALTFGGVLEPRFGESFGSLSLAVDYFRVKIDNGVAQLSATTVLAQCYNNPQRTTCDSGLITRSPYTGPGTGQLSVISSYVNISDSKAEGIDLCCAMRVRSDPVGSRSTHRLRSS